MLYEENSPVLKIDVSRLENAAVDNHVAIVAGNGCLGIVGASGNLIAMTPALVMKLVPDLVRLATLTEGLTQEHAHPLSAPSVLSSDHQPALLSSRN